MRGKFCAVAVCEGRGQGRADLGNEGRVEFRKVGESSAHDIAFELELFLVGERLVLSMMFWLAMRLGRIRREKTSYLTT